MMCEVPATGVLRRCHDLQLRKADRLIELGRCWPQDKKRVIGGGHALGTEHTRNRLVIHHYVVKSLEDFEAKRKRGNVYSLGRRPSVRLYARWLISR